MDCLHVKEMGREQISCMIDYAVLRDRRGTCRRRSTGGQMVTTPTERGDHLKVDTRIRTKFQ